MEKPSTPNPKSVKRRSAGRCWTTYEYAVHNRCGLMVGGKLRVPLDTPLIKVLQHAAHKAAKAAIDFGESNWDPCNMRIALRKL